MKTAIVTGASSGIGWATASLLADSGYRVVAAGRDSERLKQLQADRDSIHCVAGDLTDEGACAGLVDTCVARYGSLDLLVNNAGIYIRCDTLSTTTEAWRRTMAVNLDAPFFLSRAALPHLRETRGSIINIASDWGLQGGKRAAAYCASKGGLVLLTKAMALDHAREGVRVNAICPGDVDTPMLANEALVDGFSYDEALQRYGEMCPTGRVTRSDEVAAMVLYLASDAARQVTGAALSIDGGATA